MLSKTTETKHEIPPNPKCRAWLFRVIYSNCTSGCLSQLSEFPTTGLKGRTDDYHFEHQRWSCSVILVSLRNLPCIYYISCFLITFLNYSVSYTVTTHTHTSTKTQTHAHIHPPHTHHTHTTHTHAHTHKHTHSNSYTQIVL